MEAPSAREAEDRLGDGAARFCHGLECRFEVVNTDHRQRHGERFGRLSVEPHIDVAGRGRGVIGTIVGECLTERLGIEGAGQLVRGRAGELDIIDARAGHVQ